MPIRAIKIKPEFVDERGFISRILDEKNVAIKSILYISRKKGTISANHYHKKDSHYIYCLSGKVRYGEKDLRNAQSVLETIILRPGDLVLSKPLIAHVTEFLEDSIILALATEHRNQKAYEEDTIRVKLL